MITSRTPPFIAALCTSFFMLLSFTANGSLIHSFEIFDTENASFGGQGLIELSQVSQTEWAVVDFALTVTSGLSGAAEFSWTESDVNEATALTVDDEWRLDGIMILNIIPSEGAEFRFDTSPLLFKSRSLQQSNVRFKGEVLVDGNGIGFVNYTGLSTPTHNVPEPTSLILLSCGFMAFGVRRIRLSTATS